MYIQLLLRNYYSNCTSRYFKTIKLKWYVTNTFTLYNYGKLLLKAYFQKNNICSRSYSLITNKGIYDIYNEDMFFKVNSIFT